MATATERRTRAESIVETLVASASAGCGAAEDDEHARPLAEQLEVPVALVWLAIDQLSVEDIDQLVAWWPRKDGE